MSDSEVPPELSATPLRRNWSADELEAIKIAVDAAGNSAESMLANFIVLCGGHTHRTKRAIYDRIFTMKQNGHEVPAQLLTNMYRIANNKKEILEEDEVEEELAINDQEVDQPTTEPQTTSVEETPALNELLEAALKLGAASYEKLIVLEKQVNDLSVKLQQLSEHLGVVS